MRYCPECGQELLSQPKFCPNCGAPLEGGKAPADRPVSQGVRRPSLIVVILALEVAVGAGFLVLGSAFLTSISLAIFDFGIIIIVLGILILVSGMGLFRRMGWRRLGEIPALLGEIVLGAVLATVPDLLFRSLGAAAVALGILVALYPRTQAGRRYLDGEVAPETPNPPST